MPQRIAHSGLENSHAINADSSLVIGVLTQIDKYLSNPFFLRHFRDGEFRLPLFDQPGYRAREWLCKFVAGRRIQWDVQLNSLRARNFGKQLQTELRHDAFQQKGNFVQ